MYLCRFSGHVVRPRYSNTEDVAVASTCAFSSVAASCFTSYLGQATHKTSSLKRAISAEPEEEEEDIESQAKMLNFEPPVYTRKRERAHLYDVYRK